MHGTLTRRLSLRTAADAVGVEGQLLLRVRAAAAEGGAGLVAGVPGRAAGASRRPAGRRRRRQPAAARQLQTAARGVRPARPAADPAAPAAARDRATAGTASCDVTLSSRLQSAAGLTGMGGGSRIIECRACVTIYINGDFEIGTRCALRAF